MFLTVLEKLMNEKNINLNQLSKLSGIPYMTLKNFWVKDYKNIKLSTLRQLANFFNVSLDYLITGNVTDDEKIKLVYNKLNKEGQKEVLNYINNLLQNPKYSSDHQLSDNLKENNNNEHNLVISSGEDIIESKTITLTKEQLNTIKSLINDISD